MASVLSPMANLPGTITYRWTAGGLDHYFDGALILKYLADGFGRNIHSRLVRHTHNTFNEALASEFAAAGTTVLEVFTDLQAWTSDRVPLASHVGRQKRNGTTTPVSC